MALALTSRREQRRQQLLAAGKCPAHKAEPLLPGKKICALCQAAWRAHVAKRTNGGHCRNHPSMVAVAGTQSCQECIDYRHARRLRLKYGISVEEYNAKLAAQGGLCAICRQPDSVTTTGKWKRRMELIVDHDHATGAFRGLLCAKCNQGIGLFGDEPSRLIAAATYLAQANHNRKDVKHVE